MVLHRLPGLVHRSQRTRGMWPELGISQAGGWPAAIKLITRRFIRVRKLPPPIASRRVFKSMLVSLALMVPNLTF